MEINARQIQALAGFRSALRRFLAFSEVASAAAGITTQQYQALLAIKAGPSGAPAIKELAEELLLKPNSAVQLIDRLAAQGLVQRQPSVASRRSVRVSLTDKGNSVLLHLAALHIAQLNRRKKQLSEILRQLKRIDRAE